MKSLSVLAVIVLCSCASTRKAQENDLLVCDNIAVLNAKIDNMQKINGKIYAHLRLMELRQYEQIRNDSSLFFGDLVIKP